MSDEGASLPIDEVVPTLLEALANHRNVVLAAPPGSGKSTRVPLALLPAPWLQGEKILMLEPRRVAARAIAARMSHMLGTPLGGTVGYRIRSDSRCGADTRIEVITEGILTRMLQSDATLPGVGLVIFDEFHERSLHADLGLALCLDVQANLLPELRLLVMSATLALPKLLALLGGDDGASGSNAALVEGGTRSYAVAQRWLGRPARGERIEPAMTAAIQRALSEETGDILAFLPGAGEIRRIADQLLNRVPANTQIHTLFGDMGLDAQEQALLPAPHGERKVILATDIAQTSLTVVGVSVVIDSGLARVPRFDPVSGMSQLLTVSVSRATATQRAGRAGRTQDGVCYRLWDAEAHERLAEFDEPEIRAADLASLALELAVWGERDPLKLRWLDPPAPAAWSQGVELLCELGALDPHGRVTRHGKAMHALGAQPRLAHMLLVGNAAGHGLLACLLAALLGERDFLRRTGAHGNGDLELRMRLLRGDGDTSTNHQADRGQMIRIREAARGYAQQLGLNLAARNPWQTIDPTQTGMLVATAYPERIARRRPGNEPRYQLAGGRGAICANEDALAHEPWLAIAHLDGTARAARIYLAAAIASPLDMPMLVAQVRTDAVIRWDTPSSAVVARNERRLGALLIDERPLTSADPVQLRHAMLTGIRDLGLAALPWSNALQQWRDRVRCLREHLGAAWPDTSDVVLLEHLDDWLGPYLAGITRRSHLERVDLTNALHSLLEPRLRRELDRLAPTHLAVPSGSTIALDYSDAAHPALAVKVQEVFGWRASPRIGDGKISVTLRLLSPGQQPVQVTQDLASFWANGYAEVRKDLRGRYPRHPWPEDPLSAIATRRAKPRGT